MIRILLKNRFTKIVNFEQRTVLNYSGNYFDRVVLFNRKEIVFYNNIFKYLVHLTLRQKFGQATKVYLSKFINVTKKKGAFRKAP